MRAPKVWPVVLIAALGLSMTASAGYAQPAAPGAVLGYGASGWSYQQVAHGAEPNFQAPDFDATSWTVGRAGFGTTDGQCPWNNAGSVHTPWTSNTDMLLRHGFTVPAGAGVHISGTVDNNADVYVDGALVAHAENGNCQAGGIDVDVPASDLHGQDLIAIRATDVGSSTFIDVQLTLPAATAGPTVCGQAPVHGHQAIAGSVPVLFVHGMASGPGLWTTGTSPLAPLVSIVPGVTTWLFDYSSAALNWVTDPRIGQRLATAISCLARASGHPVIIVAHSLGGLATQYAVSLPDPNGGTVAADVAEVITLGTPFLGSKGLDLTESTLGGPLRYHPLVAVLNASLSICAGLAGMDNANSPCDVLAALKSPVGAALRYESPQIQALPPWPASLRVVPMAGNINDQFGLGFLTYTLDVGDVPVSQDSAIAHNTSGKPPVQVYCNDVGVWSMLSAPCFHGSLPANPTIQFAVLAAVRAAVGPTSCASMSPAWLGFWPCTGPTPGPGTPSRTP